MAGWLKIPAAAKYSGTCPRTFRKFVKKGLRHAIVGGTIYVKSEWVDDFFMSHEVRDNEGSLIEKIADQIVDELVER